MALGKPVASCAIRILVGLGKGKKLRKSPLRRTLDRKQATAAIEAATSEYFPGFTVTPARGVFMREGEPALAVDVVRTQYDPKGSCPRLVKRAQCLASDLRTFLRQHSVLVVASNPRNARRPIMADMVTKAGTPSCPRTRSRRALARARRAAKMS